GRDDEGAGREDAPTRPRPRVRGSRAGPRRAAAVEGGAAEPVGPAQPAPRGGACGMIRSRGWTPGGKYMERVGGVVVALLCAAGLGAWVYHLGSPQQESRTGALAAVAHAEPAPRAIVLESAPALELRPIGRPGQQPATLQLTESTLRRALARGTLQVEPASGGRYAVRMVRGQDEASGAWTAVGVVQTRVGPQSMVVTVRGRDVFGVLPQPDGSLLQITTTRGVTSIAPAGGMVPPGQSALGNPDVQR